jgi:mono/diheme cytochrome c family protein
MKLLVFIFLFFTVSCTVNPYTQGEILYKNFCANCHMENGEGLARLIPPLANADFLVHHQDKLACIIRYGMEGEILVNGITYNQIMPGEKALSDFEINNIINYLNTAWDNKLPFKKLPDTKAELSRCKSVEIFIPEHISE